MILLVNLSSFSVSCLLTFNSLYCYYFTFQLSGSLFRDHWPNPSVSQAPCEQQLRRDCPGYGGTECRLFSWLAKRRFSLRMVWYTCRHVAGVFTGIGRCSDSCRPLVSLFDTTGCIAVHRRFGQRYIGRR